MADAATFTADISKWIEKAHGNMRMVAIGTIQRLNEEVVITSPGPGNSVAKNPPRRGPTGFLRGSWFSSINAVPSGSGTADASGSGAVGQANLTAAQIQPGDIYYIVNTASYAKRLEYGFVGTDSLGRHYNQAGRFWVRSVIARAPSIAEEVAEQVKNGQWRSPTGGISGGQFTSGPAARF